MRGNNRNYDRRIQRRRQVFLNRAIFGGFLTIIVLVVVLLGIKALRGSEEETSSYKEQKTNASNNQSTTPVEKDTKEENTTPVVVKDHKTDGKRIVCIDPGHGGDDGGSTANGLKYEKDDALKLSLKLKTELENLGFTVYMTRTTDEWVDKPARADYANDVMSDLFISVHRNEYAADTSVKGFEAWVHSSKPADSIDIATRLLSAIERVGISRNRGVKFGSQSSETENYYPNSRSKCASVLLELGFMSNETDNQLYTNNMDAYAKEMAKEVLEWFNIQGL